jgi:hypothetical protein
MSAITGAGDAVRNALGWAHAGLRDAVTAANKMPPEQREAVLVELAKVDAAIGAIVLLIVRGGK